MAQTDRSGAAVAFGGQAQDEDRAGDGDQEVADSLDDAGYEQGDEVTGQDARRRWPRR